MNAFERHAELHQRDGNSGPHSGDDRLRIKDLGHCGYVGDHSPDERVDDVERRDVDEHTGRRFVADALCQILLQLQRELVVHVHLNRDEQELAHLEDRNAVHWITLAG